MLIELSLIPTRDLQWPLSCHWCHQGPCVVKPYILCGHARCIGGVLMGLVWSPWCSACQLHDGDLCILEWWLVLCKPLVSLVQTFAHISWWCGYICLCPCGLDTWLCHVGALDGALTMLVDVHGYGTLAYIEMTLHVQFEICLWSEDQKPMMPTKAPSWMT